MAKSKSSVEHVSTDLQMDEQIRMQENGWKFQAIGLVLMFVLVLAAAIGLFGDGLVSKTKQNIDAIEIEHERFHRFEAKMPLKITARDNDGGMTVSFPTTYLESFEIESILPEPNGNRFDAGKVRYDFRGKDEMSVIFYLIPRKRGSIQGTIEVNNTRFAINHYIFP